MWRASSREVVMVTLSSSSYTSISNTFFRPLTCSASLPHSSRIVPRPPDVLKWVRKEGGFVHDSLKLAHIPSYGVGLVASCDIPQGSDLIALPPHVPLKFDVNDVSPSSLILTDLAQQIPEELWTMRLGLKLLQERARSESFWWPYISNLPETYSVPIFFERKDIMNLQYTPLINQINKRCRFLLDFEKQVKEVVANAKPENHPFGGQDMSASSLGWAMSAVSSRAFRLHGNKQFGGTYGSVPMMLPLIDMCNHSFYPNARISQLQGAEKANMLVKVVAEKHIKRDAALEINYGNMINDLFLLDYGFVITANPYDSVELKYDPHLLDAASAAVGVNSPYFESPAAWQLEILSALQLVGDAPSLKVTLGGSDLMDGRIIAAARVLHSNDKKTVCEHELSTLRSFSAEAPLGISNELAALRTIIGICVLVLKNFPTHIVEDEALLKEGVSSFSELAINFRMEKKSLIVNVMKELSKRVKLLQDKESHADGTPHKNFYVEN